MDNSESGLKISFGFSNLSLAELKNKDGDLEDYFLVDENLKFFALFDGLDDEKNSSRASELAKKITQEMLDMYETPASSSNLTWMLGQIDEKMRERGGTGGTSAILARIVESDGGAKLIFVAIGDSRIYMRKNGQVFQITVDDSMRQKDLDAMKIDDPEERKKIMETKVRRYLNSPEKLEISYNNAGDVQLNKGDRILICSDGVTGETAEEKLSNENILAVFNREFDDETTAKVFVKVARKMDDRIAIVISAR